MHMKLGLIAAVILFGLISAAFAQVNPRLQVPAPQVCLTNANATGSFNSCINSAIGISLIAILLSFTIVALAYLVGEVFDFAVLKGWYKTEAWEAIKTVLLVAMIYSVLSIFGSIAAGLSSPPGQIPSLCVTHAANLGAIYCFANNYLGNQTDVAAAAIQSEIGISIGLQGLKTASFSTYLPLVPPIPTPAGLIEVFSINTGSDEKLLVSDILETSIFSGSSFLKDTMNLLILPMFLFINAFYDVFYVIVYVGLGILIPLGIFFRAIPFLRGIGGMVLALGIGSALVLPLLLLGFNSVLTNFFNPFFIESGANQLSACGPVGLSLNGAAAAVCGFFQTFFNTVFNPVGAATAGSIGAPAFYGYEAASSTLTSGSAPVTNLLFIYITPIIFDFILLIGDLIIAWALLQGIAKLLGGQLRLGIGKIGLA